MFKLARYSYHKEHEIDVSIIRTHKGIYNYIRYSFSQIVTRLTNVEDL